MAGTLYLCATPIGNLQDMTPRVVETLQMVDVIAAEDTRNSIRLLNHFDIHTPMTSYHEFNKVEKAKQLVTQLQSGKHIALITDAGTPAISDPGEVLVQFCQEAGITVTSLPGACACITALAMSGLSTRRFCFEGFLPADKRERKAVLEDLMDESRTMILYEAPHHLLKTLEDLYRTLGERKLTLCRELTKKFETILPTTLEQALRLFEKEDPRGEYVLVVEGKSLEERKKESQADHETGGKRPWSRKKGNLPGNPYRREKLQNIKLNINIINKDTSYRTCISTQKSPEICKDLPEHTCKMQKICKNKPLKSSYSIKRERYGVLSYAGLYVGNHDCHWSTVWSSNRKSGSCDPGCFRQCRGGSIHLYYHDRCHVLVGGTDADCKRGGAY